MYAYSLHAIPVTVGVVTAAAAADGPGHVHGAEHHADPCAQRGASLKVCGHSAAAVSSGGAAQGAGARVCMRVCVLVCT